MGTLTPDPAAEKEKKKVSPPTHPSREYWGDDTYRTEEGSTVASAFVPYRGVEVWERRRADCSADAQTARPTLVGEWLVGVLASSVCTATTADVHTVRRPIKHENAGFARQQRSGRGR